MHSNAQRKSEHHYSSGGPSRASREARHARIARIAEEACCLPGNHNDPDPDFFERRYGIGRSDFA